MDICERFLNDTEDRCLQIARQTSEIIRDFAKSMSLSLRSLNPSRNKRRTDANPTSSSKGGCSRCEMVRALFGDQRVYASHKSIMFSRKSYYFFVRPKRNFLEICVFLGRTLKAPQVRRIDRASKSKVVHVIHIKHRDEVQAPITDWLREAYDLSDVLVSKASTACVKSKHKPKSRRISLR